jgi:hypothetical protein
MTPVRGLAAVALAALVLLGFGVLITRVGTVAPPSLAECASVWNMATNTASHRKAAASRATMAVVDGSSKLDQLQQVPGMWFLVSGARWGTDSPEPEKAPDATLRPDGSVVLDGRT